MKDNNLNVNGKELTMFLASFNVIRPVARPRLFVIEKPADAELLGGGSVPARPVPRAGGLVAEDSVEPVAVIRRDRGVRLPLAVAVIRPPGVVATLRDSAVLSREHETVRTVEELLAAVDAFPVAVAVHKVADYSSLSLAGIFLLIFLRQGS